MSTRGKDFRPRRVIKIAILTAEQEAQRQKEKEEREALRKAAVEAYRAKVEVHEQKMKEMPVLDFVGAVEFITNGKTDRKLSDELIKRGGFVGVDFEWYPDFQAGQKNPLSLVQVCTDTVCYIWCLWKFSRPPEGLRSLLNSSRVIKVGCGMRGNDFDKLQVTGLPVCTPDGKGRYISIPDSFRDIQDLLWNGYPPPFKSLEHLTGLYASKQFPKTIKSTKAHWRSIMQNTRVRDYAVLDAFAAYCIWECVRGLEEEPAKELEEEEEEEEQVEANQRAQHQRHQQQQQHQHQHQQAQQPQQPQQQVKAPIRINFMGCLTRHLARKWSPSPQIDYKWFRESINGQMSWVCEMTCHVAWEGMFEGIGIAKQDAKQEAARAVCETLNIAL